MSAPPARTRFLAGLRPRLTLLLGLTLLPVTALLVGSAMQAHSQARRAAETEMRRTAEVMAQAQAQTIANARTLLAVLAQLPEVASATAGDYAACHTHLAQVLELHPDYQGLALADRNGNIVCLGSNPVSRGNIADRLSFQRVMATGGFSVGDFQITRPWNIPGLSLAYPVLGPDGTVQSVVAAALGLDALTRAAGTVDLSSDAVVVLLDHDGTVLMRLPDPEKWVGQEAAQQPLGAAIMTGTGISTTRGLDPTARVYAFMPVPGTESGRVAMALGRPPQAVYGAADGLFTQDLLGTVLILALALLATWLLSYPLILRPVDRLLFATRRLAGGDLTARTAVKPGAGELGQLASAFDVMAATLEQREAERARLYEAEHSARRQAELAAEDARHSAARTARLQAATAALSRALTWTEVAQALVAEGSALLGVSAGAITLLRDDGQLETVVNLGYSEEIERAFGLAPLDAPIPTAAAVRTGLPQYYRDQADILARFPELAGSNLSSPYEAVAALPLQIDDRRLGALTLSFDDARDFGPEDRAFLESLAQQGAQALERARLYAAELQQREAAEHAMERTTRLQSVTAELAEVLEPDQVAQVMVAQALVAAPAQAAGVWVLTADGQVLRLAHSSGYGAAVAEQARTLPLTAGTPVAWSAANGQPLWIESQADTAARFQRAMAEGEASGFEGAAVLPLEAGEHRLGVMALNFKEPRTFSAEEQAFLLTLARQCSQALERARLYAAEQSARHAAERSAWRTARLQSITATLSQTLTPKAVIDVVYQECMEMVSADAGAVVLLAEDGLTLETAPTSNFPLGSVLPSLPLSSGTPAAEAVRTGRPLWLETLEEYAATYPEYIERRRMIGFESVAYIPLSVETRVLGALTVNFAARHTFEPAERELLLALGRQGAQALERTRLFEAERRARTAAETAQKRLAVLGEASTVVGAWRSPAGTLQALADMLVPGSADVVTLFELNEGGQLQLAVHAASDPAQAERLRTAEAALRPVLEGLPGALGRAVHGGRAVLLEQLPPGMPPGLAAAAAQLVQALGFRSAIVAPLLAPGRALGGIVLAFTDSGRQYSADDMGFADELARRAALGLENARLFAEAQALNAELEARVNQRTAELVGANTSLEAEAADRKRVESELAASREQLRGLTARLQAAREEEGARISREVHDELGSALAGLKMDVAAIRRNLGETEAQRLARLEALSAQIDGTVQMVRRIYTDLRPALLDDFGLAAAMEWQLSELKNRGGIDGRFMTNVENLVWNAEGSIALFRVFQEALTNVVRHAQASKVDVRLIRDGDELELMVQDNGRGIRPVDQAGAKSLGLAGIRERVRLLDGQCQITGAPGEGTTVLIRLPLGRLIDGEALAGSPRADSVQEGV